MSSNPVSTAVSADPAAGAQPTDPGAEPTDPSQVGDIGADVGGAGAPAERPVIVVLDDSARNLARDAAVAEAGSVDHIGEFLGAVAEDDVAITASFSALAPGYLGWHWSVTLAILDEAHPTVSEVVLLPGDGALLAPAWIPWDERIRPGDVGVGDLLPPVSDDPRVVPAYLQSDDPAVESVALELGIGRVRVLSREGRIDFAERLHDGSFGPADDMALAAPAHCVTCAFYLPLAGSLGQLMGACGNEFAPGDGRVVDAGYGCGAHSETVIEMPARSAAADTVIDELSLEVHRRPVSPPVGAVLEELPYEAFLDGVLPDGVLPDEVLPDEVLPDELLPDELADPYEVGLELAEVELAEAALLDSDPVPEQDAAREQDAELEPDAVLEATAEPDALPSDTADLEV